MTDDDQRVVPESFVALFLPPGARRPNETREHIGARHEFCDDLAQLLTETATMQLHALGVTEADVLERIERGLLGDGAPVSAAEARWVLRRLAELLGWPDPGPAPATTDPAAP